MPVPVLDPHLRAGWEPDTPVGDSLLRRFLVNWTASIEAHAAPFGGRMLRRDDLADDRCRLWVGWAAAFVAAGIVDVTIVGTVPEARRRGYGAAVTWRATLAEPDLPAMLLATDEGRPVYERMGFLPLFRFVVWSRDRPGVGEGQHDIAETGEPRAER